MPVCDLNDWRKRPCMACLCMFPRYCEKLEDALCFDCAKGTIHFCHVEAKKAKEAALAAKKAAEEAAAKIALEEVAAKKMAEEAAAKKAAKEASAKKDDEEAALAAKRAEEKASVATKKFQEEDYSCRYEATVAHVSPPCSYKSALIAKNAEEAVLAARKAEKEAVAKEAVDKASEEIAAEKAAKIGQEEEDAVLHKSRAVLHTPSASMCKPAEGTNSLDVANNKYMATCLTELNGKVALYMLCFIDAQPNITVPRDFNNHDMDKLIFTGFASLLMEPLSADCGNDSELKFPADTILQMNQFDPGSTSLFMEHYQLDVVLTHYDKNTMYVSTHDVSNGESYSLEECKEKLSNNQVALVYYGQFDPGIRDSIGLNESSGTLPTEYKQISIGNKKYDEFVMDLGLGVPFVSVEPREGIGVYKDSTSTHTPSKFFINSDKFFKGSMLAANNEKRPTRYVCSKYSTFKKLKYTSLVMRSDTFRSRGHSESFEQTQTPGVQQVEELERLEIGPQLSGEQRRASAQLIGGSERGVHGRGV